VTRRLTNIPSLVGRNSTILPRATHRGSRRRHRAGGDHIRAPGKRGLKIRPAPRFSGACLALAALWLSLLLAIAPPAGASSDQTAVYDTNPLNELATLIIGTGAPASLAWDKDGNLPSDATRDYAWDGENRLANVTYGPGQTYDETNFNYDGLGRRASIVLTPTGGGRKVITNYIWCGDQLCQAQNSAGQVVAAYYAEGEYLQGSPSKSYYYAPDNIGSVRRVFGKGLSPPYDYDAYGNLLQGPKTVVTDFGWAGMFNEPNSHLYLTNYRPYDPVTGRFVTRDPAGENADPEGNLYPYAANDPVNANDPLGLCPKVTSPEESPESEVPTVVDAAPEVPPETAAPLT